MIQLPGPGDTNVCPGCRSLSCTCGKPTRKPSPVSTLETELGYAVERFEDENDRKPTEAELVALKEEAQAKVDEQQEAYDEWVSSGAFVCDVCENVHYNWAPKRCRDAHNSEYF